MEYTLDEILELDGWNDMQTLPMHNHAVKCVYDDGSGFDSWVLGFCDSIAQIPVSNNRIWWVLGSGVYPYDGFGAWRELTLDEKESLKGFIHIQFDSKPNKSQYHTIIR
jgi:hypothetical protein